MTAICMRGSVLVDGPDGAVKEGLVMAAGCKRWACELCGRRKARSLAVRLALALRTSYEAEKAWLTAQGLDSRNAWHICKLLTLTVDPANYLSASRLDSEDRTASPEEACNAIRDIKMAWNRLHSWLRKRWRASHPTGPRALWEGDGRTIPFFWVLEFTTLGWPHLHVILLWRPWIPWPDLETIRALWLKYRVGRSVDLQNKNWRHQDAQSLGRYLAKYLAKQWPAWSADGKLRRWSSSRRFLPAKPRGAWAEGGWSYAPVERHRRERQRAGATIRDMDWGFHFWLAAEIELPDDLFTRPTYRVPGLSFSERLKIGHPRYA
jgi:hypothetical protein